MVSYLAKARATIEEVERFLVVEPLEELNMKLDRYCMVLIIRSLHSNFNHDRDQIIDGGDQIASMDGLITRLSRALWS